MSSAAKPRAAFGVALVALFAAGNVAGSIINPDAPGSDDPPAHASSTSTSDAEHGEAASGHGAMPAVDEVRGLAVAGHGLRLVIEQPDRQVNVTSPLRFRLVDDHGAAITDLDVSHTKRMHLIVARRDLTGFQHLHPTASPDGTWSVPLTLNAPGSYRVFADFTREGQAITLASDLRVDGRANLRELPAPSPFATTDGGLRVRKTAPAAKAGAETALTFTLSRADGQPAALQEYLGAGGHLVALREGDLAFLHVHPTSSSGNRVAFMTTFPTPGRYRLFLQTQVAGRVHTSAFTEEVQ